MIRGQDIGIETARRMRQGSYMSADGGNPTRQLDATMHEIDPGVTSTVHRHSWDAIMVPLAGAAWTEIGGRRYDWRVNSQRLAPADIVADYLEDLV